MIQALRVSTGVYTKLTEEFLLSQSGILDASVWMSDGQLYAHVTLLSDASWTERSLKVACAQELGLELTPSHWMMLGARSKAA